MKPKTANQEEPTTLRQPSQQNIGETSKNTPATTPGKGKHLPTTRSSSSVVIKPTSNTISSDNVTKHLLAMSSDTFRDGEVEILSEMVTTNKHLPTASNSTSRDTDTLSDTITTTKHMPLTSKYGVTGTLSELVTDIGHLSTTSSSTSNNGRTDTKHLPTTSSSSTSIDEGTDTLSELVTDIVFNQLQCDKTASTNQTLYNSSSTSMAIVPCRSTLNRNANANLDDWIPYLSDTDVMVVEEIYGDMMVLQHQSHSLTIQLDDMSGRITLCNRDGHRLTTRCHLVRREVEKVFSEQTRLKRISKEQGVRLSVRAVEEEFQEEVGVLRKKMATIVSQHNEIRRQVEQNQALIGADRFGPEKQNRNTNAERNQSQNAKLNKHYVYDERRVQHKDVQELELKQHQLGTKLTEMATSVAGITRRTQTMTDVLKNVTQELKKQKSDLNKDLTKLELKYLKQATLLPMQELGKPNQDKLTRLYTSFMGDIEKTSSKLDKLTRENRAVSDTADHHALRFNKLKQAVCKLSRGISAEHQHVLQSTAYHQKKFNKLELRHSLLQNHLKDIHAALKSLMQKLNIVGGRFNSLEHDFHNHSSEVGLLVVGKTSRPMRNFDGLFANMAGKVDDLLRDIERLREKSGLNAVELDQVEAYLRRRKETTHQQLNQMEEEFLGKAKRGMNDARDQSRSLKEQIVEFKGILKEVDGKMSTTNGKLKTLNTDLGRYKITMTQELHKIAKGIKADANKKMAEINRTHKTMTGQVDGLGANLNTATVDIDSVSEKLKALRSDIDSRFNKITTECKRAVTEATAATALRDQKSDQFHQKAEEDLKTLRKDIQQAQTENGDIKSKMDGLDSRVKQRLERMKIDLKDVVGKLENLSASLLKDFYTRVERALDKTLAHLDQLKQHMEHYVDTRIEELARRQANTIKDELEEKLVKREHAERLADAVLLQIDKNFYLLIIILVLLPLFMYAVYMGRIAGSPANHLSEWWNSCCAHYFLGNRRRDEL